MLLQRRINGFHEKNFHLWKNYFLKQEELNPRELEQREGEYNRDGRRLEGWKQYC